MSTASILHDYEMCELRGYWTQFWRLRRLDSTSFLHESIKAGLLESERTDYGERAGEEALQLAEDRGLILSGMERWRTLVYDSILHHAALADILTTAVRKSGEPPWTVPPSATSYWNPSVYLSPDKTKLRRVLCVSHWTEERRLSEIRSWFCAGEICHYELPMELVVAIVGPLHSGKRNSHWTQGILHPNNKQLRFSRRKKIQGVRRSEPLAFSETWTPINREEHAEISREKWLQGMLDDDVLRETLFVVDIPVPNPSQVHQIRQLAQKKIERLKSLYDQPMKQLTGCEGPISPCPFRVCCWSAEVDSLPAAHPKMFCARPGTNSPIAARA